MVEIPETRTQGGDGSRQSVRVRRTGRAVEMVARGAVHAWWHPDRYLHMAWTAMAAACFLRPGGPPRSVLMLGLAGGTTFRILRHLLPQVRLTAVEIDPAMLAMGTKHLRAGELGAEIVLGDARTWLGRNRDPFDVVIDDCYLAGPKDVFRPDPMAAATMAGLERAVAPGGLLVVNLVTGRGHRAVQSRYRRWFRERFPERRSLTVPDAQNEILVGSKVLGGVRALRAWGHAFPHPRDRCQWRGVGVRKF